MDVESPGRRTLLRLTAVGAIGVGIVPSVASACEGEVWLDDDPPVLPTVDGATLTGGTTFPDDETVVVRLYEPSVFVDQKETNPENGAWSVTFDLEGFAPTEEMIVEINPTESCFETEGELVAPEEYDGNGDSSGDEREEVIDEAIDELEEEESDQSESEPEDESDEEEDERDETETDTEDNGDAESETDDEADGTDRSSDDIDGDDPDGMPGPGILGAVVSLGLFGYLFRSDPGE